ncbi:MAG: beta-glucosidase, partial [Bacteroidetes bacterium]
SYTTFAYENLQLSTTKFEEELQVQVRVKNTGLLAGREIVQLYLAAPGKTMVKPLRELKAFAKTPLLAVGEDVTLEFTLTRKDLASFDETQSAWVVEAGTYQVEVGASCADIRQEASFIASAMIVEKVNRALV